MNNKTLEREFSRVDPRVLQKILKEIRSLRHDLLFFLPPDALNEYTDPRRIKHSYQKAIRRYPPASIWK